MYLQKKLFKAIHTIFNPSQTWHKIDWTVLELGSIALDCHSTYHSILKIQATIQLSKPRFIKKIPYTFFPH